MSANSLDQFFQTIRPIRRVGKLRGVIEIPAFDVAMGPAEVTYYSQNLQWNNAAVGVALVDGTGLTLECWAKIPAGYRGQDIRLVGINNHLIIVHADMTATGRFSNGAAINATTANPVIPRGEWFHIAATCDGVTIKLYLNFELVASIAFTGVLSTTSTNISVANTLNGTNQVGAYINEVRAWNYARTLDQLIYAANTNRDITGVIDVGLNMYFPFDEGTGVSVITNQIAAKAFNLTENPYGGGNPAWVEDDSYPYRLGASYISGWFLIDTSGRSFSLKFPVKKPTSDVNFVPCVSWVDDEDRLFRYRLWTQLTLDDSNYDVWPLIPLYNGQTIPDGAKIEIWNLDGERDVVLETALDIDTSILNIVTDVNTVAQTATATLTVDTDIAATFPMSFPLTFDQPQTF